MFFVCNSHSAARPLPFSVEGFDFQHVFNSLAGDFVAQLASDPDLLKKNSLLLFSSFAKMTQSQKLDLLENMSTLTQNNPQLSDVILQGHLNVFFKQKSFVDFIDSLVPLKRQQDSNTSVTTGQKCTMLGAGRAEHGRQLEMHSDTPSSVHHQHFKVHCDQQAVSTPNLAEQSGKHGLEGNTRVEVVEANMKPVTRTSCNRRKQV